jgi:uncharacterized membrane protein
MAVSEKVYSGISENALGALSYLTVIPAILFLAIAPYNRSSNVRFHAWQSTILGAMVFLINFAISGLLPSLLQWSTAVVYSISAAIGVVYILLVIFCSVRALNGKRVKLPVFGAWAERQAER